MKLAICAPFMESDLWQERLRRAAPWAALEFDEFYRPEEIRSVPGFPALSGVLRMLVLFRRHVVSGFQRKSSVFYRIFITFTKN